jgi:endonuclease/exonuclease/phosphatase family metal-dependent hydrolase
MKRITIFLLIISLVGCQEHISNFPQPNNPTNGIVTPPDNPVPGKYANCLSILSNTTFDIVTWNIENFPKNANTISLLTEMINTMDVDLIAVQEITSLTAFNTLLENLPEWDGVITASGSQRLGYLYKTTEITHFEPITQLFTDNNCAFPRPALKTKATHVSGKEVTFINIHLKCCNDVTQSCGNARDRRQQASAIMKNYIDQNLNNESVIILGDWNDSITESNTPFQNFITDAANYKFTDMTIAQGSAANWSYPSWPSHLDHILITNELFAAMGEVRTLRLNPCEGQYFTTVSDHNPVLLRLN